MVCKCSWRKDDDGTYVVLISSSEHRDAPRQERSWWQWFAPVRMQMDSSGWTLAPLLQQYQGGLQRESGETLITLVVKLDAQGWLSQSTPLGKLFNPFLKAISLTRGRRGFIHPLIQLSEVLRTQAEAERFVMRPFLQGHEHSVHGSETGKRASETGIAGAQSKLASLRTKSILKPASVSAKSFKRKQSTATGDNTPTATVTEGGERYLRDHVKVLSEEPLFALASVDLCEVDAACPNIARFLPSIRDSTAPFTFVVQIMIPSNPLLSLTFAWAATHAASDSFTQSDADHHDVSSAFDLSLARFLAGGASAEADTRRNATFKLIPRVTEGSWIIKQSVGTTPCLLGRKLRTLYHRGEKYLEVDVDVASSSVAATVVGLVQGATKALVVDMGVLLEGHTADELPERLLGTVRFSHLDMSTGYKLNTTTGELTPRNNGTGSTKPAKKKAARFSRTSKDAAPSKTVPVLASSRSDSTTTGSKDKNA
ncbi:hypothetical protein WJX73_002054 [Symbiochloris irregularis]|uniref:Protein ENHANCED DISEASE RESISTANCE 2 C-terminal domain-containing protein n=1 Tax=Symbiochloris irregularis TaxID=706552 RepID=A0AAW1NMA0_9CHLO